MVHLDFVDGAFHNVGENCGASMLPRINDSFSYKLKMGCGKGLTTRDGLLTLFSLVHFIYTK